MQVICEKNRPSLRKIQQPQRQSAMKSSAQGGFEMSSYRRVFVVLLFLMAVGVFMYYEEFVSLLSLKDLYGAKYCSGTYFASPCRDTSRRKR